MGRTGSNHESSEFKLSDVLILELTFDVEVTA